MSAPAVSVIVPAFNEGASIQSNLKRLTLELAKTVTAARGFEVIVVDDGSTDTTADEVATLAASDPRVRLVRVRQNRGKGRALARGCRVARGDVFVLLDADLQIPPGEVAPLLARLETDGADMVVGSKYLGQGLARWPWPRRVMSRVYQTLTAVLFRLPLRDTQTGLKVLRAEVARRITPHLRARRFAWDLEFVLLAHRAGYRCIAAPVGLEPATRASRVRAGGAALALLDTCRIFCRDRGLASYRIAPRPPALPTTLILAGDDLGLSSAVTEGLLVAAEGGGLTSVSALARTSAEAQVAEALGRRAPGVSLGLHVDLYTPRKLSWWLLRTFLRPVRSASEAAGCVRRQTARLRAAGAHPGHVDAHRHAWFVPWVRAAVLRAARREGLRGARALRPAGPHFREGVGEGLKRLLLLAGALGSTRRERHGLKIPHGHVSLAEVQRWVTRGRLPAWTRGRCYEVVTHPALTDTDVPQHERGALDRAGELDSLRGGHLATALTRLGATLINYDSLPATPWRIR